MANTLTDTQKYSYIKQKYHRLKPVVFLLKCFKK